MRSNLAIAEELTRITGYLNPAAPKEPSCPNAECKLFQVPLSLSRNSYVSYGQTAAGTPRYRCNECRKTFIGNQRPLARQKRSEKNRDVFMLLMNRVPLSRITETTGLAPQAVYDKLDFIHRQCQAFAGNRESRLLNPDFELPKMYVLVDRQHYIVNWKSRTDRRATQLNAIGTSDTKTGYVFGMHLNFDDSLTQEEVEKLASAAGDLVLAPPYRRYARLWLTADYLKAIGEAGRRSLGQTMAEIDAPAFSNPLLSSINLEYADASAREDIESSDLKDRLLRLPLHGVQVRETYTMYAHFRAMAAFLRNAPKVRIFMDQDSGFRAAFMAAFSDRIAARTADGFFVRVDKDANAYEKRNAVVKAKQELLEFMARTRITDDYSAQVEMMKRNVKKAVPLGRWGDRWVTPPCPSRQSLLRRFAG